MILALPKFVYDMILYEVAAVLSPPTEYGWEYRMLDISFALQWAQRRHPKLPYSLAIWTPILYVVFWPSPSSYPTRNGILIGSACHGLNLYRLSGWLITWAVFHMGQLRVSHLVWKCYRWVSSVIPVSPIFLYVSHSSGSVNKILTWSLAGKWTTGDEIQWKWNRPLNSEVY